MRREERRPTRMVRKGIWASSSASEAGPGNTAQALLRGFKAEHQRRTLGAGDCLFVGMWDNGKMEPARPYKPVIYTRGNTGFGGIRGKTC